MQNTADQHQTLAYRTAPKPDQYKPLSIQQYELIHAVLGLASEVGELAGTIKKHVIYGQPLDTDNLVEEQGDLDWYGALLLTAIGELRSIIMEKNIDKLRKRYPEGYSDLAATARADKADTETETGFTCTKCGATDKPRALYTNVCVRCHGEIVATAAGFFTGR